MTSKRVLITGASIAGPAMAFWMQRLGWETVLLEAAPEFRTGGQNIDVRGPGRDALKRMGLFDAVKARNTTEGAWTFVDENNEIIARFGKEEFGVDGPTAELEILRGDLAEIIDGAASGVDHRFGDRITGLEDDGKGVEVSFANAPRERFDLVVAAEGVGSSTRKLLFGDAAQIKPWDLDSAYFSIPKGHGDGEDARWFNAPGGRSVFLRPDPVGTTRVVLSIQQEPQGWDDLGPDEQRERVLETFADAGWETPRVLNGLRQTDDFYFHSVATVELDRLSKGRVALTGDAAWAVMGSGTTLALVGPYVLAGEIARSDTIEAALDNYGTVMRPFIDKAHQVPSWGTRALQPHSQFGIEVQHTILKLITSKPIRGITQRFAPTGDDLPPLPDYPELRP